MPFFNRVGHSINPRFRHLLFASLASPRYMHAREVRVRLSSVHASTQSGAPGTLHEPHALYPATTLNAFSRVVSLCSIAFVEPSRS